MDTCGYSWEGTSKSLRRASRAAAGGDGGRRRVVAACKVPASTSIVPPADGHHSSCAVVFVTRVVSGQSSFNVGHLLASCWHLSASHSQASSPKPCSFRLFDSSTLRLVVSGLIGRLHFHHIICRGGTNLHGHPTFPTGELSCLRLKLCCQVVFFFFVLRTSTIPSAWTTPPRGMNGTLYAPVMHSRFSSPSFKSHCH